MYHSTSLLLLPFIAFLLICHANPLSGQSLAFRYQSGRVVQTNPDVVNLDIGERRLTRFTSYHLEMHWQTIGKEEWTQRFNYPAYGLGIKLGDFSMKDKLGLPMSLYGHFSSCFVRRQRLEFYYEFHLGLTFNWKSFEEGVNEYYAASGSKTSVYIAPGIGLRYRINDFVKIASGLSIVHFSNAATRLPNRGINIITPSFQMIFSRSNDLPDFQHRQWEPFRAKNEWLISTFWGQKHRPFRQTEERPKLAPYEQEYFSQYGLQLTFNRHFRYSSKIGIGVDFTIDNAIRTKYSVEESEARGEQIPVNHKVAISIYPSYELQVNKTSFFLQPGLYLLRKKTTYANPVFYQRVGMRHLLKRQFFLGVNVRAYRFHVADFIEWTIGYKLT